MRPTDVVIDRASQRKGHFVVGEKVHVVSQVGSREYTLAGVVTYGGADSAAGAQVVAFAPETAAQVLGTPGRYTRSRSSPRPACRRAQVVGEHPRRAAPARTPK